MAETRSLSARMRSGAPWIDSTTSLPSATWADPPMAATAFSYADIITLGYAVEANLVPDAHDLLSGTFDEVRLLAEESA